MIHWVVRLPLSDQVIGEIAAPDVDEAQRIAGVRYRGAVHVQSAASWHASLADLKAVATLRPKPKTQPGMRWRNCQFPKCNRAVRQPKGERQDFCPAHRATPRKRTRTP